MKLIHGRTYEIVAQSMSDSQIGAQKKKSVRNHLFVLNAIISDVLSSVNKAPIDLTVMDYRQMFDAEDVFISLNALYEAGVKDDILALIYESNRETVVSVKTPNGITKSGIIRNKIMQGDVLGPLVSSNMVDKHVGKVAIETGNFYTYKNKVTIPPLAMVDDTLGISLCGLQTKRMSEFLNRRTNLMNLQFGCDKCDKLHIGKRQHEDICTTLTIDSWEEEIYENEAGNKSVKDTFKGREAMNEAHEKKYLGDIISRDGSNKKNIKDRTNKAQGNVNKIVKGLFERPYGKHFFNAAKLMREGILLSGLLNNSESWINVTKKDIEDLEKPDISLLRQIPSKSGNPSKCFLQLELGIIPVKFVIMQKRMNFLYYILNESMDSMLSQVYMAQKEDSRKGDFIDLTNRDRESLNIEYEDEEIKSMTKHSWKKFVKEKVKLAAFTELKNKNSRKEKTKEIHFEELKLSEYLEENERTTLSQIIFSIRSKTMDIKEYQPWKYENNNCIACGISAETIQYFVSCTSYRNEPCKDWTEIYGSNKCVMKTIGLAIEKRVDERKAIIEKAEGGQAQTDSTAPGDC